jgi:hypothetical protein
MLVELRGTGGQTMGPPSIHPSGERVEWTGSFSAMTPAPVEYHDLLQAVRELAAAALLRRHRTGSRHDSALHLAGAFARSGWPQARAERMVLAIIGDVDADKKKDLSAALPERLTVTARASR